MAATLTTPPPSAALSGDGIYVEVDTDLINSDASEFMIELAGSPDDGEDLEISWPGGSVIYTATDTPTGAPNQWPTKPVTQPLPDYADDIADFLRNGGLLGAIFNVRRESSGGSEFIYVPHAINGVFDLVVDANGFSNVTVTANNVTSDAPPPNLRMYVSVHSAGVGANDLFGTELLATHANYNAATGAPLIDIHAAFSLLTPDLPEGTSIVKPTGVPPSTWFNREASLMFQRYYIRYGEKYGTPALVGPTFRTDDQYTALLGAHSGAALDPAIVRIACNDHYRRDGAVFRKPVHEDQPDWLYVFTGDFIASTVTASLSVLLYWSDGTTSTYTPFGSGMPSLEPNRLYMFATGYRQLKLNLATPTGATDPSAYLVGYDVQIGPGNEDTPHMAVVRYNLPDHSWWNLFLLYANGMGGMETAWLRGKAAERYAVESQEYQRPRYGSTRPADFRDFENLSAQGRPSWEVSTGWYDDPYYLIHLRQLPMSRCWLVDVDNRRFLPVTVESTDSPVTQDDETIFENNYKIVAGWYDDAANL